MTGARAWDALERRTAEMLSLAAETRGDTRRIHEKLGTALDALGSMTDSCGRIADQLSLRRGGQEE